MGGGGESVGTGTDDGYVTRHLPEEGLAEPTEDP
jgi:hypothetical protein